MISCSEYDYIEIICMHHYPIILTLKSGEAVEGIALDTQYNAQREECIKVNCDGNEKLVVLESISLLDVTVANPHLKHLAFSEN